MTLTTSARPWLASLLLLSGLAFADEAGTQALHHTHIPTTATRYAVDYATPQVHLVRADGRSIWLPDELDNGRPVVLDFVYTTCTAICPVSSQTFSELEKSLGADRASVHLVSVSIDPEEDTPERLSEYSRHYDAGPQWNFYTETLDASQIAQRAFRVFRGNKMSHDPVTLVRLASGRPWVLFDGFATAQEILAELRS